MCELIILTVLSSHLIHIVSLSIRYYTNYTCTLFRVMSDTHYVRTYGFIIIFKSIFSQFHYQQNSIWKIIQHGIHRHVLDVAANKDIIVRICAETVIIE